MTPPLLIDVYKPDPTPIPVPPSWSHAPARVNCPKVLEFCAQLSPSGKPVVVPVRPELLYGAGPYPMGRCYDGVRDYQNRVGGKSQLGWMIWETEGIYLRAFHHCVHWNGQGLTDVSPQFYSHILFLPTAEPGVPDEEYLRWRGSRDGAPSRSFPLSDSAIAKRILKLHQLKYQAEKHSAEWFELLEEIASLEFEFHEWTVAKSTASRRRKAAKPM